MGRPDAPPRPPEARPARPESPPSTPEAPPIPRSALRDPLRRCNFAEAMSTNLPRQLRDSVTLGPFDRRGNGGSGLCLTALCQLLRKFRLNASSAEKAGVLGGYEVGVSSGGSGDPRGRSRQQEPPTQRRGEQGALASASTSLAPGRPLVMSWKGQDDVGDSSSRKATNSFWSSLRTVESPVGFRRIL